MWGKIFESYNKLNHSFYGKTVKFVKFVFTKILLCPATLI